MILNSSQTNLLQQSNISGKFRGEGEIILPSESRGLAANTDILDIHDGGFGNASILCGAGWVFLPVVEMGGEVLGRGCQR